MGCSPSGGCEPALILLLGVLAFAAGLGLCLWRLLRSGKGKGGGQ